MPKINSKGKGSRFERWVANALRDIFPDVATSRLMSKIEDDNGVDLVNTGEFAFQTKHYAKRCPDDVKILSAIKTDKIPVYVKKSDRNPVVVSVFWDDFVEILNKYYNER